MTVRELLWKTEDAAREVDRVRQMLAALEADKAEVLRQPGVLAAVNRVLTEAAHLELELGRGPR